MKILLTGASGLLGSHLAEALSKSNEVTRAGLSRIPDGGVKLDVSRRDEVQTFFGDGEYDAVVHAAAIPSPEQCAKDPAAAYLVNTVAVEYLAEACADNDMKLVYVSTDYVFDGSEPPYREDSRPAPVNLYGRTKLAGEFAAKSAPRWLVTRIPALWGEDPDNPKANQKAFLDQYRRGEPFSAEDVLVRHYSLAADIASAIAFCVDKGMMGTVHLSARESQTKAELARAVGRFHGFDPALVLDAGVPVDAEPRPFDPTLDPSLYESLGGPHIRGLSEVLGASNT